MKKTIHTERDRDQETDIVTEIEITEVTGIEKMVIIQAGDRIVQVIVIGQGIMIEEINIKVIGGTAADIEF